MSAEVRVCTLHIFIVLFCCLGGIEEFAGSVISPTISPLRIYLGVSEVLAMGMKGLEEGRPES